MTVGKPPRSTSSLVVRSLVAVLLLLVAFYVGGFLLLLWVQPGEGNMEPRPVSFTIEVPRGAGAPADRQLRLAAEDVAILRLPDAVVSSASDSFTVRADRFEPEGMWLHCLAGPAEVVASGVVEVVIPAGTCLTSRGPLVVPTPAVPAFDAYPETLEFGTVGTSDALSGPLVVSIDGCTSIDGKRLIWPDGTTIDAAASVVQPDGRVYPNGEVAVLQVARQSAPRPGWDRWCPGDDVFFVDTDP